MVIFRTGSKKKLCAEISRFEAVCPRDCILGNQILWTVPWIRLRLLGFGRMGIAKVLRITDMSRSETDIAVFDYFCRQKMMEHHLSEMLIAIKKIGSPLCAPSIKILIWLCTLEILCTLFWLIKLSVIERNVYMLLKLSSRRPDCVKIVWRNLMYYDIIYKALDW